MRRWWLAVPLVGTLTGCATFDAAKGHDEVASLVEARMGVQTGWGEGAPGAEALAERVETLLADGLTAERAVAIALMNNPGLQETYASLGVSQADLLQAGLLSNPRLSIDIGIPVSPGAIVELGGSIVQSFLDVFMLPLKRQVAQEQFLADLQRVAHAALDTAAQVKTGLLALQAAERRLSLHRESLAALEADADLAQRQRNAGNINKRLLAQREVAHQQARVDVASSELDLVVHRERLNRLLGLWGVNTQWRLAEPLPQVPPEDPRLEQLESLAVRQRLDLAAARHQVALLDTGVRLARTFRYVGTFDVGAHTHQDPNGPVLIGPDVTLELPIFDQRQAVIARLESQREQATRRLEALAIEARSHVREARAALLTAAASARHLERHVLPLHQQVLDETLLQYNGMQLSLAELVEAKRNQLQAQAAHVDAVRAYWSRFIELERLVGGRLAPSHPSHPSKDGDDRGGHAPVRPSSGQPPAPAQDAEEESPHVH